MEVPYNLSSFTNVTGIQIIPAINYASGGYLILGLIFTIFIITLITLLIREYDVFSSLAVASLLCFIPSLIGRLIVYNGVPMIGTEYVILFGTIVAVSAFALKFLPNK